MIPYNRPEWPVIPIVEEPPEEEVERHIEGFLSFLEQFTSNQQDTLT